MKLRVIPSFQPSGVSGGIERLKISHFEADKTVWNWLWKGTEKAPKSLEVALTNVTALTENFVNFGWQTFCNESDFRTSASCPVISFSSAVTYQATALRNRLVSDEIHKLTPHHYKNIFVTDSKKDCPLREKQDFYIELHSMKCRMTSLFLSPLLSGYNSLFPENSGSIDVKCSEGHFNSFLS